MDIAVPLTGAVKSPSELRLEAWRVRGLIQRRFAGADGTFCIDVCV
jgi:hypothetical protein